MNDIGDKAAAVLGTYYSRYVGKYECRYYSAGYDREYRFYNHGFQNYELYMVRDIKK